MNPFYLQVIPAGVPFCNRENEAAELAGYARAKGNVVLFSPRRFGKTSLVKRVQSVLAGEGAITIYADLFGVSSLEDIAESLARAVFRVTRDKESLFARAARTIKSYRPVAVFEPDEATGMKVSVQLTREGASGMQLLEDVLESLGSFIAESDTLVHIALDEFQEVTRLDDAVRIEGILRSHIQHHRASYFFIGSRRSVLLSMFNDRQRAFFRSAINYELGALPPEEFAGNLVELFGAGGKICPVEHAREIITRTGSFPFYAQKLCFFAYELSGPAQEITKESIAEGFRRLIDDQRYDLQNTMANLAPRQMALLKALAQEPTGQVFSLEYMRRHRLGSLGAMQAGMKKLKSLDLIGQDRDGVWRLVDPILEWWVINRI